MLLLPNKWDIATIHRHETEISGEGKNYLLKCCQFGGDGDSPAPSRSLLQNTEPSHIQNQSPEPPLHSYLSSGAQGCYVNRFPASGSLSRVYALVGPCHHQHAAASSLSPGRGSPLPDYHSCSCRGSVRGVPQNLRLHLRPQGRQTLRFSLPRADHERRARCCPGLSLRCEAAASRRPLPVG